MIKGDARFCGNSTFVSARNRIKYIRIMRLIFSTAFLMTGEKRRKREGENKKGLVQLNKECIKN